MSGLLGCQSCPRLYAYRREQQTRFPQYHNLPVAPIGEAGGRLLIVGLAPGLHGANASGRPFTGDASGRLLFDTLFRFGFVGHPDPLAANGEPKLRACRITNAVKCVPPKNRPLGDEIKRCNLYLRDEISQLADNAVVLALGTIAHRAVLGALDAKPARYPFAHLAQHHPCAGRVLIDSYHCSRYNLNTGRLTPAMFDAAFASVRRLLS